MSDYLSIKDINALTNNNVIWRNLISLKDYPATVAVTKGKQVVVTPTGQPAVTYPLTRDQPIQFPIFGLSTS